MAVQVTTFSVEGIPFVAGLLWQPLSETNNGEKKKEIKALAKELNLDIYVLRNTNIDCVGLASSQDVKHGHSSAAAVVSKSLDVEFGANEFIFVSRLDTGDWLYIAQRDGLILTDGDKIYKSEEEARSRLLEDLSLGDWALTIAPSVWGISKSTERSFTSLIPKSNKGKVNAHKWWRLRNVDSSKEAGRHAPKILLLVVLLAAAAFGYKTYLDQKQKAELEKAEAEAKAMMAQQNKTVEIVHPWKNMPLAFDFLNACQKKIKDVRLFPGNWQLETANCIDGTLVVAWKPIGSSGWIDHLKQIHPNAVISLDGSIASVSVPMGEIKAESDEVIQTENERLVEMYSAAQRYGFKFTVTPREPVVTQLPGQDEPVAIPQDWNEIGWKAENIDLPEVVLAGLSGNGFRMTSMSAQWNNGKLIWTMEGNQYVK